MGETDSVWPGFHFTAKGETELLCPVMTWLEYKHEYLPLECPDDVPAICEIIDDHLSSVSENRMRFVLQHLLSLTGLTNYKYTLHSFRRGGACFYAENGINTEIKRLGLWRSDAIQLYLRKLSFRSSSLFSFLQTL